jgi:hypothetical protein
MPHSARSLKIRLEGRRKKVFLRNIAGYLYHKVTSLPSFPIDSDEERSADKRKIFGSPYHLVDRGAVFVGHERVLGAHYRGEGPTGRGNFIQLFFSNPKRAGENANEFYTGAGGKLFDYAEYVLDTSEGELGGIPDMRFWDFVDEAVDNEMEDLWRQP